MAEEHAHRDGALSSGPELGPVTRDGCIEIDLPAVHEDEQRERGHRLPDREDVDEGIAPPRPRARPVRPAGPQIDDESASDPHRHGRTDLGVVVKIGGERTAYAREALIAR